MPANTGKAGAIHRVVCFASHRDGAGFELTLYLWERVHPRRGP